MLIDVANTPVVNVYQLLVGLITPRPIAWVSTVSPEGVVNLAPFSFFNVFGANPPVVVISPTLKRDGTKKDTLLNLEANGEMVINAATEAHAEAINRTSRPLPHEESELELIDLPTVASQVVRPPRLADVPFSLECRVRQIVPVGNGPISANLVIAEVVMIHLDEMILGTDGAVDPRQLKTIARLGSDYWCRTSDLFELERPL
jgi:flavin reductase (DIM6/NTAB) family NADH-FMN oxidoreductase RutF